MPELRCATVDDYYLLRDGASGIFLAASQFPKNRETRAPRVAEIKPHANELDPKFNYLLEAPETDPEGRPTVIRYSRKQGVQYVQSEEGGKATGWRAAYRNGRWVAEDGRAHPKTDGSRKAAPGSTKRGGGRSTGTTGRGSKSSKTPPGSGKTGRGA
jgi:DNA topoisomerase-1